MYMQDVLKITIFHYIDTMDCGEVMEYTRIINKI
jgi:hypothetical protein